MGVDPDGTGFDELDLHDMTTMLDVCASLDTYDENAGTIRLAHYTIQEYLFNHPTIRQDSDLKVTISCIRLLLDNRFAGNSGYVAFNKKYPFWSYACLNLMFHISQCEESLTMLPVV